MEVSNELKAAITEMPEHEKDKLLFRLLRKEPLLIKQLEHRLLGSILDVRENRERIRQTILHDLRNGGYYSTLGLLMMGMRAQNGSITEHVKITKDRIGEVSLTLDMVAHVLQSHADMMAKQKKNYETFAEYMAKKAKFIWDKLSKLHPDYDAEFEEKLNFVLKTLHEYAPTKPLMLAQKLPTKWRRTM